MCNFPGIILVWTSSKRCTVVHLRDTNISYTNFGISITITSSIIIRIVITKRLQGQAHCRILTLFRLGGSGKCPRRFQLLRTSLIFKKYLQNVATFTKIYWETRFWKNFASRVSHVAMATTFSTPCLLKF